MQFNLPAQFFLAAVLSLCVASASRAAEKKTPQFIPGEKVRVELGMDVYPGVVVGTRPGGRVVVKYTDKFGYEQSFPFSASSVARPARSLKNQLRGTGLGENKSADIFRDWSDKSGKINVHARLIGMIGGKVQLEQLDGKVIEIPLDRLDPIARQLAETVAGARNFNSFNPAAVFPHVQQMPGETGVEPGDWSSVKQFDLADLGPWKLTADRETTRAKLEPKNIRLRAGGKRTAHAWGASISSLEFVPQRNELLVFATERVNDRTFAETNLWAGRVELLHGKISQPVLLKSSGNVLAVDPSGRRVAIAPGPRPGKLYAPNVQVWDIDKTKTKLVNAWSLVQPGSGEQFVTIPRAARFVDANHLLIAHGPSELVLWDVSKRSAVYTVSMTGEQGFALSPTGKYLAVAMEAGLTVFDPLTGKAVGRLPSEPSPGAIVSFSPSGDRLAAVAPGRVIVWNFESGVLYRDFSISSVSTAQTVDWVAEDDLLIDRGKLIDIERRILLWEYRTPIGGLEPLRLSGSSGGIFWYLVGTVWQQGLKGIALPHAAAKRQAAAINADDLLVLKPGTTVSLDVRLQEGDGDPQKLTDDLTARLSQLKIRVDASSPLVLTATTEAGATEQKQFRKSGTGLGNGDVQTANVTQRIARLRLTEAGKTLWEVASTSNAPLVMRQGANQTLQETIDQREVDMLGFFHKVPLPQYLARPSEGGAYGASLLTETGIRNVPVDSLADEQGSPKDAAQPNQGPGGARPVRPRAPSGL